MPGQSEQEAHHALNPRAGRRKAVSCGVLMRQRLSSPPCTEQQRDERARGRGHEHGLYGPLDDALARRSEDICCVFAQVLARVAARRFLDLGAGLVTPARRGSICGRATA